MYCTNCGNQVEAGAFCTRCGARLAPTAPNTVQPGNPGVPAGAPQVPVNNPGMQTYYPGTPPLGTPTSQEKEKEKKKRKAKIILIAVLLIAAFIGGILVYQKIDERKQEEAEAEEIAEFAAQLQGTYYSVYEDYTGSLYIALSLNANNTYVIYDTYTGQQYYSGRYEVADYGTIVINNTANTLLIYDNGFSVSNGFCTNGGEYWYFSMYF